MTPQDKRQRIRPAATLALVRDGTAGLEVLLLQRTWQAAFLPGYYVFPGGAVDAADADLRALAEGRDDAEVSQALSLEEGGADYNDRRPARVPGGGGATAGAGCRWRTAERVARHS